MQKFIQSQWRFNRRSRGRMMSVASLRPGELHCDNHVEFSSFSLFSGVSDNRRRHRSKVKVAEISHQEKQPRTRERPDENLLQPNFTSFRQLYGRGKQTQVNSAASALDYFLSVEKERAQNADYRVLLGMLTLGDIFSDREEDDGNLVRVREGIVARRVFEDLKRVRRRNLSVSTLLDWLRADLGRFVRRMEASNILFALERFDKELKRHTKIPVDHSDLRKMPLIVSERQIRRFASVLCCALAHCNDLTAVASVVKQTMSVFQRLLKLTDEHYRCQDDVQQALAHPAMQSCLVLIRAATFDPENEEQVQLMRDVIDSLEYDEVEYDRHPEHEFANCDSNTPWSDQAIDARIRYRSYDLCYLD
ncbi:MAG: hypothetical protein MHM6MM_001042 [Cercozoa sp. M6MM]